MKSRLVLACILLISLQSSCIWKLWTDDTPIAEKIFDVYGTIESISLDELVIQSNENQRLTFRMVDSSVRGGDFKAGAYVHVYYHQKEAIKEVTMVVEKIG
jgi:outer membrane lipoprotein-sorting protein